MPSYPGAPANIRDARAASLNRRFAFPATSKRPRESRWPAPRLAACSWNSFRFLSCAARVFSRSASRALRSSSFRFFSASASSLLVRMSRETPNVLSLCFARFSTSDRSPYSVAVLCQVCSGISVNIASGGGSPGDALSATTFSLYYLYDIDGHVLVVSPSYGIFLD